MTATRRASMGKQVQDADYWRAVYGRSMLRYYGVSLDRFLTDPWLCIKRFGIHDETFPRLPEIDLRAMKGHPGRSRVRMTHRPAPVISIEVARPKQAK